MANNLEVECSELFDAYKLVSSIFDLEYRELMAEEAIKIKQQEADFVPIENIYFKEVPRTAEMEDCSEVNQPAGSEFKQPAGSEFNQSAGSEFNQPAGSEFNQPAGSEFNQPVASGSKQVWLEAPTKLLLSVYEELRPKVGQSFGLKNKSKMWQQIQQKIAEEGYKFSVQQVQAKYRSLERRYKSTKLNNSKTGRNRQNCPFENELDKVFKNNKAVSPDFTLSNDENTYVSMSAESTDGELENSQASTSGLTVARLPRKRKVNKETPQDAVLKKLDSLEQSRIKYQNHRMATTDRLLEILEERNQIEKERNEVLRSISSKMP